MTIISKPVELQSIDCMIGDGINLYTSTYDEISNNSTVYNFLNDTWTLLGTPISFKITCMCISPITGELYVGGFDTQNQSYVYCWDNIKWNEIKKITDVHIYSIEVSKTGEIYVGGGVIQQHESQLQNWYSNVIVTDILLGDVRELPEKQLPPQEVKNLALYIQASQASPFVKKADNLWRAIFTCILKYGRNNKKIEQVVWTDLPEGLEKPKLCVNALQYRIYAIDYVGSDPRNFYNNTMNFIIKATDGADSISPTKPFTFLNPTQSTIWDSEYPVPPVKDPVIPVPTPQPKPKPPVLPDPPKPPKPPTATPSWPSSPKKSKSGNLTTFEFILGGDSNQSRVVSISLFIKDPDAPQYQLTPAITAPGNKMSTNFKGSLKLVVCAMHYGTSFYKEYIVSA